VEDAASSAAAAAAAAAAAVRRALAAPALAVAVLEGVRFSPFVLLPTDDVWAAEAEEVGGAACCVDCDGVGGEWGRGRGGAVNRAPCWLVSCAMATLHIAPSVVNRTLHRPSEG
jgi:hypothetical protein